MRLTEEVVPAHPGVWDSDLPGFSFISGSLAAACRQEAPGRGERSSLHLSPASEPDLEQVPGIPLGRRPRGPGRAGRKAQGKPAAPCTGSWDSASCVSPCGLLPKCTSGRRLVGGQGPASYNARAIQASDLGYERGLRVALEATGSLSKAWAALAERQAVGDGEAAFGPESPALPCTDRWDVVGCRFSAPRSSSAQPGGSRGSWSWPRHSAILVPFTPLYPLGLQASSTTSLERKLLTFLLGAHYIIY